MPGSLVHFDASASTGAGTAQIVHYEWDLDGDGTFETDTGSTPTTSQIYASKGTYAVGVRVTDDQDNSDTRTIALAVTAKPNAAMTITPSSPLSLVNASLDATGSFDPDGTIVRYEWDLDGDGTYETDAGNIPTIQRLFGTSGPAQRRPARDRRQRRDKHRHAGHPRAEPSACGVLRVAVDARDRRRRHGPGRVDRASISTARSCTTSGTSTTTATTSRARADRRS